MKQTDERDVVFARLRYQKGSDNYDDYYKRNPERKERDDAFRSRPFLGGEDAVMYDPLYSKMPEANFDFLADIRCLCTPTPCEVKVQATAEEFTNSICGLANYYGAKSVAITNVPAEYYYSHFGRPKEKYGHPVPTNLPTAIVFTCEMSRAMMFRAPKQPAALGATKGYIDTAIIGMQLAYFIASLGYSARNNMDGDYMLPLVPLAIKAGIGELGKNSLLLTKEFGPRVRLGAVLTDLPLQLKETQPIGLNKLCDHCQRCVVSCPGRAIMPAKGGNFSDDECYKMWQSFGTDCGICIAACPYANEIPEKLFQHMHTEEGVQEMVNYCDRHYPRRNVIFQDLPWMQNRKLKEREK